MREILFRGKRLINGEWMEGDFVHVGKYCAIIPERPMSGNTSEYFVDPATVGQYTGLRDKNGKRIFEGDIVGLDAATNEFWALDFGNCGGVQNVGHEVGYMGFYLRPLSESAIRARDYGQRVDPIYYLKALGLHIIGNIHDNKELLIGTLPMAEDFIMG